MYRYSVVEFIEEQSTASSWIFHDSGKSLSYWPSSNDVTAAVKKCIPLGTTGWQCYECRILYSTGKGVIFKYLFVYFFVYLVCLCVFLSHAKSELAAHGLWSSFRRDNEQGSSWAKYMAGANYLRVMPVEKHPAECRDRRAELQVCS